jgi:hypothetical protein
MFLINTKLHRFQPQKRFPIEYPDVSFAAANRPKRETAAGFTKDRSLLRSALKNAMKSKWFWKNRAERRSAEDSIRPFGRWRPSGGCVKASPLDKPFFLP